MPLSKNAQFGQGVPDESHVTLKWGYQGAGNTSTAFGISALGLNDLRDPGIALAATSAIGFSGYMANYHTFYVLASRIRIRVSHGSTSSGTGSTAVESVVGVFPSLGATSANDVASAQAQNGCKFVTFDIGGMKTLECHCSCPQLQGVTKQQYIADSTNWGSASASPTDNALWSFWSQSSATQTGVDILYDITIEYDCVFFRRKSPDLAFERDLLKLVLERETRDAVVRAANEEKIYSGDNCVLRPRQEAKTLAVSVPEVTSDKDVLPNPRFERKAVHAAAPAAQPVGEGSAVDRYPSSGWTLLRSRAVAGPLSTHEPPTPGTRPGTLKGPTPLA